MHSSLSKHAKAKMLKDIKKEQELEFGALIDDASVLKENFTCIHKTSSQLSFVKCYRKKNNEKRIKDLYSEININYIISHRCINKLMDYFESK
jgi:hypothetical protein